MAKLVVTVRGMIKLPQLSNSVPDTWQQSAAEANELRSMWILQNFDCFLSQFTVTYPAIGSFGSNSGIYTHMALMG